MPQLANFEVSEIDAFRRDALAGLSGSPKTLPSKYLYDAKGSQLFDEICLVSEYYVTRTETALLSQAVAGLAELIPDRATLVEFGSGASIKTQLLLEAAPQIYRYIPIDISPDAVGPAIDVLGRLFPALEIAPLVGDFTGPLELPHEPWQAPLVGFFPGSTIGNFAPDQAVSFLENARAALGRKALLIVGADLEKSERELVPAYDDAEGVTAAFNMNLLDRMNRELGADFDPAGFRHRAVWNAVERRVEMHLESLQAQEVRIGAQRFRFAPGETIHTENSYKYTTEGFAALALKAGWQMEQTYLHAQPAFAIFVLCNGPALRARSLGSALPETSAMARYQA